MEPVYLCPNCGYQGDEAFTECPRCGIVVRKFLALRAMGESVKRAQFQTRPPTSDGARDGSSDPWASELPEGTSPMGALLRAALLGILAIWGVSLVLPPVSSNAAGESFLHLINLPFHEAGHVIFSPFGRFITSLGGTLGQLLVPFICGTVFLWKSSDPFGATVCLWWLGENLVDIAPYINDARAGVLPLLGGNTGQAAPYGFHDWEYLLNETGLLRYDHQIAMSAHALGAMLMMVAVGWGALMLLRYFQSQRSLAG